MLKRPKSRSTTNSNHRFHKYKNLIKGLVPAKPNLLWVADITYIDTENGCCYLHLITDAYSHMILGWKLANTLKAIVTLEALEDAIAQTGQNDLTGLIHHSDRGIQYCCDLYIGKLKQYNITISMTEDYKPTDNAIAERVNGIIKQECVYPGKRFMDINQARSVIGRFIKFYNTRRPHMSIGMITPESAHHQYGKQNKMWKTKVFTPKNNQEQKKDVFLYSQQ
jgi:putative transposase